MRHSRSRVPSIFAVLALAACYGSTEPLPGDTGVRVLVAKGPIDPVEVEGQPRNTAPVPGARVVVRTVDGDGVEDATTDDEGIARLLLAPGSYTIVVTSCPGTMSLPKESATVVVVSGEFAFAELVCDTGIR